MKRASIAVLLLGLLGACREVVGPEDLSPEALADRTIAGGGQVGILGQSLPDSLSVTIRDPLGVPVSDLPLEWRVLSGGGSLPSTTTRTDAEGRSTNSWLLGPVLGDQSVELRALLSTGPVPLDTVHAEAVPAVLEVSIPEGFAYRVGDTLSVPLRIEDGEARAIEGASELVVWSSLDPSIASVEAGELRALKWGTTEITARIGSAVATTEVVVEARVDTFPLFSSKYLLGLGSTFYSNNGRLIALTTDHATSTCGGTISEWLEDGWQHRDAGGGTCTIPRQFYISKEGVAWGNFASTGGFRSTQAGTWTGPTLMHWVSGSAAEAVGVGHDTITNGSRLYQIGATATAIDIPPPASSSSWGRLKPTVANGVIYVTLEKTMYWNGTSWVALLWPGGSQAAASSLIPPHTLGDLHALVGRRLYRIRGGKAEIVEHPLGDEGQDDVLGAIIDPMGHPVIRSTSAVYWRVADGWREFHLPEPWRTAGHWREQDGTIWLTTMRTPCWLCADVRLTRIRTGE